MAEKKKLSKKTLAKSFRNWSYGNLTCFSQEHMQLRKGMRTQEAL